MSGHIDEVRTESYVGAVSPADKKASSARAGAQNTGGPNHLDLGTSPFVIPTKQPLALDADDEDGDAGFDPMDAARSFEARQTQRGSVGVATAFGEVDDARPPVSLQWEDICLDVTNPKTKEVKPILSDISGCAPSGEVLAIMGSSGAGKTTLLNLLGGSLVDHGNTTVHGRILANGTPRKYAKFASSSAIVLQDDLFFPELTVKETIAFSATLRLPRTMPQEQKDQRVNSIISELGLRDVQDTHVGNDQVRGVSGGERKRVNIGTELVADPSVIFLDEPTSGLDSFQAQNVMVALKVLAKHGRTIITTIHQPRSDIYLMFDKLCILSKGKLMYFGAAGDTALDYFKSQGYSCPINYNPADYFIDLISFDARSAKLEKRSVARIEELDMKMKKHFAVTGTDKLPETEMQRLASNSSDTGTYSEYASSTFGQLMSLLPRSMNVVKREKAGNAQLLIMQIIPALMAGLIWFDEGADLFGFENVQPVAGVIFFCVIHNMFNPVFPVAQTFPLERDVVLKERISNTYSIGPYFLSKAITELPRAAFVVFVFHAISYYMIGLRNDTTSFFTHYAFLLLICGSAEGIALIVSAAAKGPQEAAAAVPGPLIISILFGGFFISADKIPIFISWLRYLTLTKYGFEGIMQTGEEILEFYNLTDLSVTENAIVLFAYCIITRLIAYLVLLRNVPKRVRM